MIRRARLLLALIVLASCGRTTTLRCDPTPSWTSTPEETDAGTPTRRGCRPDDCRYQSVIAGGAHTCVLAGWGEVFCFGANEHGQSDPYDRARLEVSPTLVIAAERHWTDGVSAVTAGAGASCAVTGTDLTCWGHRAITGGDEPLRVIGSALASPTMAALHVCAAAPVAYPDGMRGYEQRCFGAWDGIDLAAGPAPTPRSIGPVFGTVAIGGFRTCVERFDRVECHGAPPPDGAFVPGAWAEVVSTVEIPPRFGWPFSVAPEHACRIDSGLRCWGRGDRGQLGDGALLDRDQPVTVSFPPATDLSGLCTGGEGSILERDDGTLAVPPRPGYTCAVVNERVQCWGANDRGQLGDGTRADRGLPGLVELPTTIAGVSCGGAHACAWAQSGRQAWCWGANDRGQLGVPSSELEDSTLPIEIDLFP